MDWSKCPALPNHVATVMRHVYGDTPLIPHSEPSLPCARVMARVSACVAIDLVPSSGDGNLTGLSRAIFIASVNRSRRLKRRRDQGLRRRRHHRNFAEADDIGRESRGAFRQAGFRLQGGGGYLSLPGWRNSEVLLHEGGERAEISVLLDECLPDLPAVGEMHDGKRAAHLPLGT
jgi:hypothetical protein